MSDRIDVLRKVLKKRGVSVVALQLDATDLFTKMDMTEKFYADHPAYEQLRFVLKDLRDNPREGFIGMASGHIDKFFHFGPKEQKICVFTYNQNTYRQKVEQILFIDECYGRVVLECYPEIKKKLTVSMSPVMNKILYRLFSKFLAVSLFSCDNNRQVIINAIREYAKRVFQRVLGYDPRYDAFPLFADRMMVYLKNNQSVLPTSPRRLDSLVDTVYSLISDIDSKQVASWKSYCECAQDMIWRGVAPRSVLLASILGSESPYFQSIGRLMAKYIGVQVQDSEYDMLSYNAFASEEENAKRHEKEIREMLSDALDTSFEAGNSGVFHERANAQNEELLKGSFVGWCAKALQSTADVFDKMIHLGEESHEEVKQKMREKFLEEISREDCDWGKLKTVSDEVVERIKSGGAVTHSVLVQIANDNDVSSVAESVETTTSSKGHQEKLENSHSLDQKPEAPEPQSPSLKAAPKMTHAPAAPSMGIGGGRSASGGVRRVAHSAGSSKDAEKDSGKQADTDK